MGRWEIKDVEYSMSDDELPKMEFIIHYNGWNMVDAYEEAHRAVNYLNTHMFAERFNFDLYSNNFFDIRSSSFSLKPDAPDIRRKIEKVIFNDPATIIIWKDGNKTVVKASEGEEYDPEKGFAMAIAKYALGNQGNYYETFKKWLPKEEKKRSYNKVI